MATDPLGSTSPEVMLTNVKNLDLLMQDSALTHPDRFGVTRRTWKGIEYGVEEKINSVANAAATPLVASIAEGITKTTPLTNKFFRVIANGVDALTRQILFENVNAIAVPRDVQITREDLAKTAQNVSDLQWADYPWAVTDENGQPIIAVTQDGFAHIVTNELPGTDLLHHLYRWGVFNTDTGDLVHGYTHDNGVALGGSRILDAEFQYAFCDEEQNIIFGRRWDGSFYPGTATTDVVSYTTGSEGKRRIWVWINGMPYQLTSSGDAWAPKTVGESVQWLTAKNGGVAAQSTPLPAALSVATFIRRIFHILSYGQSLSIGSGTTTANTSPHCANRLLTIQQGVIASNTATPITQSSVVPLKPLSSVVREPPVVAMSINLLDDNRLADDVGIIGSAHGYGGQSIAQLERGTAFYPNLITAATYAKPYVENLGLSYTPIIDWIQGEADRNLPAGEYTSQLMALRNHLEEDLRVAINQPDLTLPMLVDQISNMTAYKLTSSFVPLEQLQMALDHPGLFYCAGPKYWLETITDGVHLTTESSQRLGCMHARAAGEIFAGKSWLPTYCTSAVRHGRVVTLTFHTPIPPLVIDTTHVSDPGMNGLRWIDDSQSASVTSVTVNSDNTVTLVLNTEPTGSNPRIGIADVGISGNAGGPFTGARANLRDSAPDFDILGTPFFNWACHQRIAVIAE